MNQTHQDDRLYANKTIPPIGEITLTTEGSYVLTQINSNGSKTELVLRKELLDKDFEETTQTEYRGVNRVRVGCDKKPGSVEDKLIRSLRGTSRFKLHL